MVRIKKRQTCAAWGCENTTATYDYPLCYPHWTEWQRRELEECMRCHWLYGVQDIILNDWSDYPRAAAHYLGNDDGFVCGHCALLTVTEVRPLSALLMHFNEAEAAVFHEVLQKERADIRPDPPPRIELKRQSNYVYVLKKDDGSFYVGQTMELELRLQEHRDGKQSQTRDHNPKLVYFEKFEGEREVVTEREGELTRLSLTASGQRQLMRLIEEFRKPLRLLDLDA